MPVREQYPDTGVSLDRTSISASFVSCKHSGASEITPQLCMKRHCFICFEGEGHRML